MADQADVETALVAAITAALYPAGTGAASVLGTQVRIYRGWPVSTALEADLAAGIVHVSVFSVPGTLKIVTPLPAVWQPNMVAPGFAAQVGGDVVTFSGAPGAGMSVGVLADGVAYAYRPDANDTAQSVASTLATQIRGQRSALLLNASLRFPGVVGLAARVVGDVSAWREVRRQRQEFRVAIWSAQPAQRDLAAARIDAALAVQKFLSLADGSSARLLVANGQTLDQDTDAALYRRDLLYHAEYATTETAQQPVMLFGELLRNDLPDRLV